MVVPKNQIKKNGKYTVRLRVTSNRLQKYFGIDTKDGSTSVSGGGQKLNI